MAYGGIYALPDRLIVIAPCSLHDHAGDGSFEIVKNSVARLSDDRRVQAILIAFSFGAFVEGPRFRHAGAISGALMVGLGFRARDARSSA